MTINLRYLQNTLEQLMLFIPGLLGLAVYCSSGRSMRAIVATSLLDGFVVRPWDVAQLLKNYHYAAALQGAKHIVEDIGQCFNTTLVTIRRRRDIEWIMESSNFERCESSEEAYEIAKQLLSRIHQLLALYLSLYHCCPVNTRIDSIG